MYGMTFGWHDLIYHLVMVVGKLLIQHLKKKAWVSGRIKKGFEILICLHVCMSIQNDSVLKLAQW